MDLADTVDTKEAADMLGISTVRIKQFISEGKLTPLRRVGFCWLFARADIEGLRGRPGRGRPAKGTAI